MIKAVLFDLDGTLFDSSPGIFHTANYTMRTLGFSTSDDPVQMKKFIGPPLRECFRITYGTEEKYLDRCAEVYREEYSRNGIHMMHMYDGMRELLERLKGRGYLLGICTNKIMELALRIVKEQELEHLFDTVQGIDRNGKVTKSDCILNAMDALRVGPDRVLMVGDTENDSRGAREANVRFCGVTYGFGFSSVSEIDGYAAEQPMDILDILSEI
ncbi:MAG: HAD-IA family hydrolase [Spirochaetales bacterium]|nr:HAD-IA family hydrolase [Spirochaetales bacterium]